MNTITKLLLTIIFSILIIDVSSQAVINVIWIDVFVGIGLSQDKLFNEEAQWLLRDELNKKCDDLCNEKDLQMITKKNINLIESENFAEDSIKNILDKGNMTVSQIDFIIKNRFSKNDRGYSIETYIFQPILKDGRIEIKRRDFFPMSIDHNYRDQDAMRPLASRIADFLYKQYEMKYAGVRWDVYCEEISKETENYDRFKDFPSEILNIMKKSPLIDESTRNIGANAFFTMRFVVEESYIAVYSEIRDRNKDCIAIYEYFLPIHVKDDGIEKENIASILVKKLPK